VLYISHPTTQPATICTANTQGGGTAANVVGLWHLDQMSRDSSGGAGSLTFNGDAVLSTAQKKFANTATSFFPGATAGSQGTGSAPNFVIAANGDATFEAWTYLTAALPMGVLTGFMSESTGATLYWIAGDYTVQGWDFENGARTHKSFAPSFSLNTWHHNAWVRSANVWDFWYDGVKQASSGTNWTTAIGNSAAGIVIGNAPIANNPWTGYISEVRVSNMARYTGAGPFTPQTTPFCDN
jgi:hypothetical protein